MQLDHCDPGIAHPYQLAAVAPVMAAPGDFWRPFPPSRAVVVQPPLEPRLAYFGYDANHGFQYHAHTSDA